MRVEFGVLGPVSAWDAAGGELRLGGPRHREVLARLLAARRRTVTVSRLVADLWEDPPAGAVGAVRTFVAALRRALEPDRPPRSPSRLLVTVGPGYQLRADADAVDAWRFEEAVARAGTLPPAEAAPALAAALGLWRGPAYADFAEAEWARGERARLTALRLHAVEQRAEALLASGAAREAVPDLDEHVAAHPWREDGWRLLATALYRSGRQGEALTVLRRARRVLAERLGAEPGPALARLEQDVLRGSGRVDPVPDGAGGVWSRAAAAYDSAVPVRSPARLEATVGLLRELAVTGAGGLGAARAHRAAAVAAAEATGDVELTARVIGVYDVPAVWTRVDDVDEARTIVHAAARTLARLPDDAPPAVRARLLAAVAVESRGDATAEGPVPPAVRAPGAEPWRERAARAAEEAERIARRLSDASLLAFALNGAFMQAFGRCGLAPRREAIGAELVALAREHGLVGYEVLGRLVRLQALCALGDFPAADPEAEAVAHLAERRGRPLAGVFVTWYEALRATVASDDGGGVGGGTGGGAGGGAGGTDGYARAVAVLEGCGMPGLVAGLPALVRLAPVVREGRLPAPGELGALDWGPYAPWARPFLLAGEERWQEARAALRAVPRPPHDLLQEAMWCLLGRAAVAVGDRRMVERAVAALRPAAGELAGAGSGLLTFGPVAGHLDAFARHLEGR
ncbi:BTAD domain-containing putative transcriptional regulator [Allostreptomyces psammosilenae]|uniref:DNA-binding SARP family transcriptional activator n=1 Tax=Allostreptomyces psammosilenae TaxID=1892865 RepID=A0A853A498_9ACTN|nr:BTAD domain-containing putative transcriptional regulator [Allostreptomyces psammosilenae]NYI08290.1 DNA-binding SARP family transcriptional activator [Allostreptomyces psammosilenae]